MIKKLHRFNGVSKFRLNHKATLPRRNTGQKSGERERDKEVHDHVNKERKCSLCYVATGTQFRVSGENGNG